MQKTLAAKDVLSRMTAGPPDAIVQGIQIRFACVLDDNDALFAAASCPKFNLLWLRDADRREQVKELLTAECCTTAPAAQSPPSVPPRRPAKVRWTFSLLRYSQRRTPTLQKRKSWTT
ncbi:hypothetical protein XENOCAPTIV_026083 [Xenoophorus captivus]|uniref:Uncharacterized protein n=1 Tax=Xenoophorus captivus TaxID=1517983 RepID=A0ABV0QK75_9TELE